MVKSKDMKKVTPYSIALYALVAIFVTAFWIVLFQFTKTVYTEDTLLWGILPWSDAYFMFALMFMIFPTVMIMILYLLLKKSRK